MFEWFRGYLGDPLYGKYLSFDSVSVAAKATLRTILVPVYGRAWILRAALHLALLVLAVSGLVGIRKLSPLQRAVVVAAWLQCFCTWMLILWFEPFHPKFWMLSLLPFVLALACSADLAESILPRCLPRWSKSGRIRALVSLVPLGVALCVLGFTLRYSWRVHDAEDARSRESMERWLAHSTPDDILITAGDLVPQLWFWANRPNTLHLYHQLEPSRHREDRFECRRDRIDRKLEEGASVLLTPAVCEHFQGAFLDQLDLEREDLRRCFDGYQKEELFS